MIMKFPRRCSIVVVSGRMPTADRGLESPCSKGRPTWLGRGCYCTDCNQMPWSGDVRCSALIARPSAAFAIIRTATFLASEGTSVLIRFWLPMTLTWSIMTGACPVVRGSEGAAATAAATEFAVPAELSQQWIGFTVGRNDLPGGQYFNWITQRAHLICGDGSGQRELALNSRRR